MVINSPHCIVCDKPFRLYCNNYQQVTCGDKFCKKVVKVFGRQRHDAIYHRGIPFLLTIKQWLKIWIDSGHFHERGRLMHQYCMARKGDVGPYAVGNVMIITNLENLKGNKNGVGAQSIGFFGLKHTEATKAKISAGVKKSLHLRQAK